MLILLLNQDAGAGSQNLSPTLVTNDQSFFAPTVTVGAVSLLPSLVSDGDTFFAAAVSVGGVALTPDLFSNSNTFYAPVVSQAGGTQSITPDKFDNAQQFFAATVSGGATENRFQMDYGVFVPPRRKRKEEPESPVDETYDEEIALLLLAA